MTKTFDELRAAHGKDRAAGSAMDAASIEEQLKALPGWKSDGKRLVRTFTFDDYWSTIAFVNALAFVVHREDHHPELVIKYDRVEARFDTHSAGGITDNDFICAAKASALYDERPRAASA